jgi:hypothetical protein
MSRRPLFRGARDDASIIYCANCDAYLSGVRYIVTVDGQKFKVCGFECADELRAEQEVKQGEEVAERL